MNIVKKGFLVITVVALSVAQAAYAEDESDIETLRAAAERGDADAQEQLGTAYQKGDGVKQDDVVADKWFLKAARQGNAQAQFDLGFAYRGGFGVQRDEVQSYMWFDLAAAQGNEGAADMRSAVAEIMTYDQITQARKLSRNWKPGE